MSIVSWYHHLFRKLAFYSFHVTFSITPENISPYSVQMRENTDQKNFEYGHFSRSRNWRVVHYLRCVRVFDSVDLWQRIWYIWGVPTRCKLSSKIFLQQFPETSYVEVSPILCLAWIFIQALISTNLTGLKYPENIKKLREKSLEQTMKKSDAAFGPKLR